MGEGIVIDGLAYRPSTGTWRTLPEFPLREREFPVIVWIGRELIVWRQYREAPSSWTPATAKPWSGLHPAR